MIDCLPVAGRHKTNVNRVCFVVVVGNNEKEFF